MPENNVPTVLNPYSKALEYREKFFLGVLPLPYKQKEQPPTGWTGREAGHPKPEKIKQWLGEHKQQNICIRLAGVDKDHELVGIDVDDYWKGDKKKNGGDQLVRLQNQYGKLPDTWISSARTDGRSGIRHFRVPRGLAFRGKIDKDIEVIQKGHRYAVVWPSVHPEGGTYWWFPPGTVPSSAGRKVWDGNLFSAWDLPLLPEPWIDFLTNGKVLATEDGLIDVDSSVQDVYDWAEDTFHGEHDAKPCSLMRKKLDLHKKHVEDEATSHDKLTNGHWNLIRLAAEGHLGWSEAVVELESHFKQVTLKRGKRGLDEVNGEIFRSRIQALRKIKGQINDRTSNGIEAVDRVCTSLGKCSKDGVDSQTNNLPIAVAGTNGGSSDPPNELDDVPQGPTDWSKYTTEDDGNALWFQDFYKNVSFGNAVRWVEGYGWIVWHNGSSNGIPHWERDELGEQITRRMWHKVKKDQKLYIEALRADFENQMNIASAAGNPISGNGMPADLIKAKGKFIEWRDFVKKSGNNRQFIEAMKALKPLDGINLNINELDRQKFLLGVANGVIELDDAQDIQVRKALPFDYITLNTNVPYEEPTRLANKMWYEFLDMFIPDKETQEALKVAMGYCLIGHNPKKKIFVLQGESNSGKSTMLGAIEAALGDYAQPVSQELFKSSRFNTDLSTAINKRVVTCSEFDRTDELSASMIKRLSGNDEMSTNIKFSNEVWRGRPQFTTIIATNGDLHVEDNDQALKNRLHVIPFNVVPVKIRTEMQDAIALTCKVAVLKWLIEGYKEYRQIGDVPMPESIRDATDQFAAGLDETATFVYEYIRKSESKEFESPGWCVTRTQMYSHYEKFCMDNKIKEYDRLTPHGLTKRLRGLGIKGTEGTKTKNIGGISTRWWYGVKLISPKAQAAVINMKDFKVQTETESEAKSD